MIAELYRPNLATVVLTGAVSVRHGGNVHGLAPEPCQCGRTVTIPARSSASVSVVHWWCRCGQQFSFRFDEVNARPRRRKRGRS